MKVRQRVAASVLATVACLAAGAMVSAPASAATASCTVPNYPGSCTTGWIYHNPYGHYVDYNACGGQSYAGSWKVIDIDTGVTVGSGTIGSGLCHSGTIYGLYGRYRAKMSYGGVFDSPSIQIDNV